VSDGTVEKLVGHLAINVGDSTQQVDKLDRSVGSLYRNLTVMRRGAGQVRTGVEAIKTSMMPFMILGGVGAAFATREVLKFDHGIRRVGATLGAAKFAESRQELEMLAKTLAMDPTIHANPSDSAADMLELSRSGVTAAENMKGMLVPALQLANVESISSAESLKILMGQMLTFGRPINAKNATRTADQMAIAAKQVKASVSDIGVALRFGGAAFKIAGFTSEDAVATAAIGRSFGLQPSTVGTGMRRVSTSLADHGSREALEKQLMLPKGALLRQNGELKSMADIIETINVHTGWMTNPQRGDLLKNVFDTRGMTVMANLLQGGAKNYQEMLDVQKDAVSSGEVARQTKIVSDSYQSMVDTIKSSASVAAISLSQLMLMGGTDGGGLRKLRDYVVGVSGALTAMSEGMKSDDIISKMAALGVTIKPEHVAMAESLKEAVQGVKEGFLMAYEMGKKFVGMFGEDGAKSIAKWITMFALLSPLLLMVSMTISSVMNMVRGVGLIGLGIFNMGRGLGGALGMAGAAPTAARAAGAVATNAQQGQLAIVLDKLLATLSPGGAPGGPAVLPMAGAAGAGVSAVEAAAAAGAAVQGAKAAKDVASKGPILTRIWGLLNKNIGTFAGLGVALYGAATAAAAFVVQLSLWIGVGLLIGATLYGIYKMANWVAEKVDESHWKTRNRQVGSGETFGYKTADGSMNLKQAPQIFTDKAAFQAWQLQVKRENEERFWSVQTLQTHTARQKIATDSMLDLGRRLGMFGDEVTNITGIISTMSASVAENNKLRIVSENGWQAVTSRVSGIIAGHIKKDEDRKAAKKKKGCHQTDITMNLNGKELARAVARANTELETRTGSQFSAWHRIQSIETGSV
jgi:TP901 family phage tail tape measure protein